MHDAYMYDCVIAVILEKLAFIHVLHAKEATRRISLCSLVAGCTVTINIQINPHTGRAGLSGYQQDGKKELGLNKIDFKLLRTEQLGRATSKIAYNIIILSSHIIIILLSSLIILTGTVPRNQQVLTRWLAIIIRQNLHNDERCLFRKSARTC